MQEGRGGLMSRDSRSGESALGFTGRNGGGRSLTAEVSWPPSCSCCTPTCSSGTSVGWRRSGCAVQCRSAGTGNRKQVSSGSTSPHHGATITRPATETCPPPQERLMVFIVLPVHPAAGGGAESENGVVDVEPGCA